MNVFLIYRYLEVCMPYILSGCDCHGSVQVRYTVTKGRLGSFSSKSRGCKFSGNFFPLLRKMMHFVLGLLTPKFISLKPNCHFVYVSIHGGNKFV